MLSVVDRGSYCVRGLFVSHESRAIATNLTKATLLPDMRDFLNNFVYADFDCCTL